MADDKRYKINERIFANELRVIDNDGSNIGVISKQEALSRARASGLDLVEISPKAVPPVAKIMDFKKFLYEEKKKSSSIKAKSKQTGMKEHKVGPNIGDHDLSVKIERAKEWLQENNRVRFTVKFSGRELAHPEVGWEKINRVIAELAEYGSPEADPKFINRTINVIILPK